MALKKNTILNGLKKFRPGFQNSFERRKVGPIKKLAFPRNQELEFRANVEGAQENYVTRIRFKKIKFSDTKSKGKITAQTSAGNDVFADRPDMTNKTMEVFCSCPDFRFAFEFQLFRRGGLDRPTFRKYSRKTPPPVRPEKPKNPNPIGHDFVNPDNRLGFCKHLLSMINALKARGQVIE